TVIVGIRDADKKRVGVSQIAAVAERARTLINARIEPPAPYEIETLEERGKQFLLIHVEKGDFPPYYYAHEDRRAAYIRRGDESVRAPAHILNELILRGQHRRYDEMESPYSAQDVSFSLLRATYKYETGRDFIPERDLPSFGLLTPAGKVTYAGLLLADQPYLSQSQIFCTRWKGVSKGSVGTDTIDDKEFRGNIITLLSETEQFVLRNSRRRWKIVGMRREETVDYPMEAVREAIVNAIIHRDYFITGSEIHVDMYDDHLDITSPGGMSDGRQIQNLDIREVSSNRRNPVIADIFSRLGYAERRGSGLSRIRDSFTDADSLRFSSDEAVFIVTMKNANAGLEGETALAEGDAAHEGADTALEGGESALLEGESALTEGKSALLEGETAEFSAKVNLVLPDTTSQKTRDDICELFKLKGYTNQFERKDVVELFGVKERRASAILKLLCDAQIITRKKLNTYYFIP
ncbi:MAG: ATP-binding protein, partial [Methanocorpusculum sp.]|nr:ATP-binding protein [Methanocorpusculum sp.]